MMLSGLSIVVPVYNSQESLPLLAEQLAQVLPDLANQYELILVNDGSHDQSWQVVEALALTYAFVRGFDLVRNFGQHNALLCGIRAARYEVIVTMDDDLQHPPSEIHRLIAKLDEGYDVVYGTPNKERHGFTRDLSSRLVKWTMAYSLRVPFADKISAFRAFRSHLRDLFKDYSNTYVSIDVLLSWGTGRFSYEEVEHHERTIGRSQYTVRKLLRHMSNMILGYSVLPLRLASFLGFFATLFGLFVLGYVFVRWLLYGSVVQGFAFTASLISIFAGAQLFVLGIIGEYLARMYTNMMAKPPYMIYRQTDDRQ